MGAFDGTILASLTEDERGTLELGARRARYRRGATIVWRGEILTSLYILESGRAAAHYRRRRATAELALATGDFFGEGALEDDATSEALVRADGEALVLSVPTSLLRAVLSRNPGLARSVVERVQSRRCALWSARDVLGQLPPPSMN